MQDVSFIKMHGLGNDFVVVDARRDPVSWSADQVRAIADRRTGVGCDQLITLGPARNGRAEVFMRIHNADGGEVAACGNAARCVAALIMDETGKAEARIETAAGVLEAEAAGEGRVAVDMGEARLEWSDIPLARPMDTLHLELAAGQLSDPVGVSMGNPHAVFFVDEVADVDLESLGPELEHDALFPERANIGIVAVRGPASLRVRVWERGAGLTPACGTGACAALVAASRRGLGEREAEVELDGGSLEIVWREDGHVIMTGPVARSYTGTLERGVLA